MEWRNVSRSWLRTRVAAKVLRHFLGPDQMETNLVREVKRLELEAPASRYLSAKTGLGQSDFGRASPGSQHGDSG
jgi:hypothetical protein